VPELRAALATVILASAAVACSRPPGLAADLIVTHANVWTGNPAQPYWDYST